VCLAGRADIAGTEVDLGMQSSLLGLVQLRVDRLHNILELAEEILEQTSD